MAKHLEIALFILSLHIVSVIAAESDDFLAAHNDARTQVGVGAMQWSDELANYASSYAQSQIDNCISGNLVHSGGQYGENLFWGSGIDYSPYDAVQDWVNESQYYDYNSNTCADGQVCGHYTQVVWANSVNLGCSKLTCDSTPTIYVICSYSPAGNVVGEWPY